MGLYKITVSAPHQKCQKVKMYTIRQSLKIRSYHDVSGHHLFLSIHLIFHIHLFEAVLGGALPSGSSDWLIYQATTWWLANGSLFRAGTPNDSLQSKNIQQKKSRFGEKRNHIHCCPVKCSFRTCTAVPHIQIQLFTENLVHKFYRPLQTCYSHFWASLILINFKKRKVTSKTAI